MKSLSFLLFFLVSSSITYADVVTIECPDPAIIQFHKMKSNPSWDEYIADGLAKITSGNATPFPMAAKTDANSADYLDWATYYRGDLNNDFICNYTGRNDGGNKAATVLAEYDPQQLLQNCHFREGDPFECDASKHACVLICNLN